MRMDGTLARCYSIDVAPAQMKELGHVSSRDLNTFTQVDSIASYKLSVVACSLVSSSNN